MAPKVSINIRLSKIQSNTISFKNKRRRKVHTTTQCAPTSSSVIGERCSELEANQTNKSPKHRWKLNGNDEKSTSDDDERCMTDRRFQCFQQQFSHNNSAHDARKADEKRHRHDDETVKSRVNNVHHFIDAKSSQHDNTSRKPTHFHDVSTGEKRKPQRRDFVNCRTLRDWATASSVRKLLPIFILVNMLPFLYAGESSH